MTTAATQEKTAIQIALERALAKQMQAPKAKPATVAPRKPAAPKQAAKPAAPKTVAALAAQIAVKDRAGALDLKKPASELAADFGVDVSFLQAAMLAAGYVRIRRGPTAQLFFGRTK